MTLTLTIKKGGVGSGHFGHRGRPGKRGGSTPGKGGGKGVSGKKKGKGRYISIPIDGTRDQYKAVMEQFRDLQPEDTIRVFHAMSYLSDALETLEGEGLDPDPIAHERGRIYGGGKFSGFHVSPSRQVASSFGKVMFEMDLKAKQMIAPFATHWDIPTSEEADEFWRDLFPKSFRPSLSSSLRLGESQGLLIEKIDVKDIKRVWTYNIQTYEWTPRTVEEALEHLRKNKEFVLKQLPIDAKSKENLFVVRRNIFFDDIDTLAEQLFTGEISIGEWQETFKDTMRQYYSSSAAIGKGGWDEMDFADWGRLGPVMKDQYQYLQGFAEHISDNRKTVSLKYIKARSKLYGEGAGFPASLMEAGVVFEALLPYIPRDGSTKCLNRCHCSWINRIVRKEGAWNIVVSTWLLGEADHCITCIGRDGHIEQNRVHETVVIPEVIGGY